MQCRGAWGTICHRQVRKGQWYCNDCLGEMLKVFGERQLNTSGLDDAIAKQRDRLAPKGR